MLFHRDKNMFEELIRAENIRLYSSPSDDLLGAAELLIAERFEYYNETKNARTKLTSEEEDFLDLLMNCVDAIRKKRIDYMVGILMIAHDVINVLYNRIAVLEVNRRIFKPKMLELSDQQ